MCGGGGGGVIFNHVSIEITMQTSIIIHHLFRKSFITDLTDVQMHIIILCMEVLNFTTIK